MHVPKSNYRMHYQHWKRAIGGFKTGCRWAADSPMKVYDRKWGILDMTLKDVLNTAAKNTIIKVNMIGRSIICAISERVSCVGKCDKMQPYRPRYGQCEQRLSLRSQPKWKRLELYPFKGKFHDANAGYSLNNPLLNLITLQVAWVLVLKTLDPFFEHMTTIAPSGLKIYCVCEYSQQQVNIFDLAVVARIS